MIYSYPAIIYQDETMYNVFLPDFNDATCDKTFNDAIKMAINLITNHLFQLELSEKEFPNPTNLNEIDLLKTIFEISGEEVDISKCSTTIISFDYEEYVKNVFNKPVKKTLLIPYFVDRKARKNKINFSKFLTNALIMYFKENNL